MLKKEAIPTPTINRTVYSEQNASVHVASLYTLLSHIILFVTVSSHAIHHHKIVNSLPYQAQF